MGCTPPEKRHTSIPAINAVPKNPPTLSPRSSDKNNDKQIIPKLPSNESLKNKKKYSMPSNHHLNRVASPKAQRFSYEHQQSPQKPAEKQVIRVLSPLPLEKMKQRRVSEKEESAKPTGINSLDLLSWIKMPKENAQNAPTHQKKSARLQSLGMSQNQEHAEMQTTAVFGRSKKWKEQALISQLKNMNHQNFQRIKIDSRKFQ